MPYATGRVIHDADAHIMETPTWLRDHAEARFRDALPVLTYPGGNELRQTGRPEEQQADLHVAFDGLRDRHASAEYRTDEAAEIMARKNFAATGSFIAEDRPRALDLLGFRSQLLFNTFHNGRLHDLEHSGDLDLAYAAARAHNRGMLEFCSVDPRLLPACYVPLADPVRAVETAEQALADGAAALLVASGCPPSYSPSHTDLFGVWARAEEAGIPVVLHVGGTGKLLDPHYFVNGLPVPPDFHGGTRISVRSTTWPFRDRPPRPWPPSSSTVCSSDFRNFGSGSSNRGRSGFLRGSARWSPRSRPLPATRTGCAPSPCDRPSTSTARSASRPTRPRTSVGSSTRPERTW